MNGKFLTASIIMLGFLLIGMTNAPAVSYTKQSKALSAQEDLNILVDQAFTRIKLAYESESLLDFMELLDDRYESRLEFESNLQTYFLATKNPEIIFMIDAVLANKDKVSVRLHWFKRALSNSGIFSKSEGFSQFVFLRVSGVLKLIYIRQDNPFF